METVLQRQGTIEAAELLRRLAPPFHQFRFVTFNANAMLHRRDGETHRAPPLEAFAAVHRTALRGLEGDRGLLAALRANRLGFDALHARRTVTLRAAGFARFATFRFVLEAFVGEKHLFAGREDKFSATIGTLQNPIMVFHTLLRTRTGRGQAAYLPDNATRSSLIG